MASAKEFDLLKERLLHFESLRKCLLKDITCPICREYFNDSDKKARALPCLHSVCQACLNVLCGNDEEKTFKCSICRKTNTITLDGVEGFPIDFHKQNLLEYFPNLSSQDGHGTKWHSKHFCSCTNQSIAKGWCNECKYLCRECLDCHLRAMPILQDHEFRNLTESFEIDLDDRESENICSLHQMELTKVCYSCEEVLCDSCFESGHIGEEHNVRPVPEAAAECRSILKQLITTNLSKEEPLMKIRKNISTNLKVIKKQAQESLAFLSQEYAECHQALNDREHLIRKRIDDVCTHAEKLLKGNRESADLKIGKMWSTLEYASKVIDQGCNVTIVKATKILQPTMQEIAQWDVDTKSPQCMDLCINDKMVEDEISRLDKITSLANEVAKVKCKCQTVGGKICVDIQVENSNGKDQEGLSESFKFTILEPGDSEAQSYLQRSPDGNTKLTFTPRVSGKHVFEMSYNGSSNNHVTNQYRCRSTMEHEENEKSEKPDLLCFS